MQVELGLSKEDHQLLSGALDYKDKRVKDVMTPIERVYSFEASARLNFATMMEIYKSGVFCTGTCHLRPPSGIPRLPLLAVAVWQCSKLPMSVWD